LVLNASRNIVRHVLEFENFLPQGFMLSKPVVVLHGAFHLEPRARQAFLSIVLNENAIATDLPLNGTDGPCIYCANCQHPMEFQPPGTGDIFAGYNYQGNNSLLLTLSRDSIAISQIDLIFYAFDAIPQITSMIPAALPIIDPVKPLSIVGENFRYYFSYECQWQDAAGANFTVDPIQTNINQYTCGVPNASQYTVTPGPAKFWFVANVGPFGNADVSAGPFPYTLYQEPVIQELIPPNGDPAGGTWVMAAAADKNWFNCSSLQCRFGTLDPSPAGWVNSTFLRCLVPQAQPGQSSILLSLSENGQDWTNAVTYTYSNSPPPGPPFKFWWLVVISVVCFVFIMVLIGGYFITRTYNSTKKDEQLPWVIEGSAFIPFEELTIKERVGRGSFGVVHRGFWRFTEVAVKQIPTTGEVSIQDLIAEAKLMANLRHPNITQLMGLCLHEPDAYIITEFISLGSLFHIIHTPEVVFEPEHVRKFALDTCKGMAYIHGARIMHRDLKCSNLLVDKDWNVKVSDFGLSRFVTDIGNTMTACGTPSWAAPEVLRNVPYSFQADVYSFGICLWEMATQQYVYDGLPPYHVVIQVATKGLRPEIPSSVRPEFADMLQDCWDEDPSNRPSFGQLVNQLTDMDLPKPSVPNPRYKKKIEAKQLMTFTETPSQSPNPSPMTPLLTDVDRSIITNTEAQTSF